MSPTEADVTSAREQLDASDASLQRELDQSGSDLAARMDEYAAAAKNLTGISRSITSANDDLLRLKRQINSTITRAVLKITDTAIETGEFSVKPLAPVHELRTTEAAIELYLAQMPSYLLEAQELEKFCESRVLLAEAHQMICLANWREFQRNLALAGAVALEGELRIDEARTVTGSLRRQAAQKQLEAQAIEKQITELQAKRKPLNV